MPIIAAIGGNKLQEAADPARIFGALVSEGAILMTGGEPGGRASDVKNAALRGCEQRSGRMISVLPKRQDACLPTGRRILLTTKLDPFERDPITGAAGDVVVAFSGNLGTLVELAYAALEKRPIVFCGSAEFLKDASKNRETEPELRAKLAKAVRGYPLLATDVEQLIEALAGSFTMSERGICVNSPQDAATQALRLTQGIDLNGPTNFLGLPNDDGSISRQFEAAVAALSQA